MQLELMHETLNDALIHVVTGLGGYKKVGVAMRPELSVEQGASWLRDCLNPARREHLAPDQVVLLLKLGRQAGIHAGMGFVAGECGYSVPTPVEPEDERAKLMRLFNESVRMQSQIAARMERLMQEPGPTLVRRSA